VILATELTMTMREGSLGVPADSSIGAMLFMYELNPGMRERAMRGWGEDHIQPH
jgi:hypothetical protein